MTHAALASIAALHSEDAYGGCSGCATNDEERNFVPWPCATRKLADEGLTAGLDARATIERLRGRDDNETDTGYLDRDTAAALRAALTDLDAVVEETK